MGTQRNRAVNVANGVMQLIVRLTYLIAFV